MTRGQQRQLGAVERRGAMIFELAQMAVGLRPDDPSRRAIRGMQMFLATTPYAVREERVAQTGVYAFSFPDHLADEMGRRKIKVGRSTVGLNDRVYRQVAAMADAPEVLRLYPSVDAVGLERRMHGALHARGRHYEGGAGREWFVTSVHELDEVYAQCIGDLP